MTQSQHFGWVAGSALCGALWGVMVASLTFPSSPHHAAYIFGISPLLGLMAGVLARPFRPRSIIGKLLRSTVGLYGTATMLGVALGSYDYAFPMSPRGYSNGVPMWPSLWESLVVWVRIVLFILTLWGYVLVFIPLSYFTYTFVWSLMPTDASGQVEGGALTMQ